MLYLKLIKNFHYYILNYFNNQLLNYKIFNLLLNKLIWKINNHQIILFQMFKSINKLKNLYHKKNQNVKFVINNMKIHMMLFNVLDVKKLYVYYAKLNYKNVNVLIVDLKIKCLKIILIHKEFINQSGMNNKVYYIDILIFYKLLILMIDIIILKIK